MIEMTREQALDIFTKNFKAKHQGGPEVAQVARAIVKGNTQAIENCVRNGSFSLKILEKLSNDAILQSVYREIVETIACGESEKFNRLYKRVTDQPDTFCGWLVFYNQYLESTLDLDLMERTNLYYHARDFAEDK